MVVSVVPSSSHLRATSTPKCLPSLKSMAFSVHQYATVTTTNWKRNALFQECKASMSGHNVKKANLFAARKQRIKLPSSYDGCRISEFLREPSGTQAMLNTSALQDFQTLDTNTYRCFLPKLQLLNFEAAPVLDLRVTPTEEDCTVEMLSCKFQGSKVVEYQNDHFSGWGMNYTRQIESFYQAFMTNRMTWDTIGSSEVFLEVDVKLNLTLEIYTRPFTLLPTSAVEGPGNLMMQALVDRLVPLLLDQLLQDYEKWAAKV